MIKNLNNNPINTCILQIDFSPILAISSNINILQDKYRILEYPRYYKIKSTNLKLDEENKEPKVDIENNWIFASSNESEKIIINQTQFSYQVDNYIPFNNLIEQYKKVLNVFSTTINLTKGTLIKKIGLRYVNCIEGKDNFEKYIKKEYQGRPFSSSIKHINNFLINNSTRAAIILDNNNNNNIANAILRIYQNDLGLKIPNNVLSLKRENPIPGTLITFIDIDLALHFRALNLNNLNQIYDYSKMLNDKSAEIFFDSITEEAKEDWQ